METVFLSVLSSAAVAALLAVVIGLVGLRLKRPAVLHVLWVVVLVKLFVPPVFEFALLPEHPAGEVSVQAMVAGTADMPAELAPSELGPWRVVGWSLVALWLAGSLVVLVSTLIRLLRFKQTLKRACPVDSAMIARIDALAAAVGCSRRPLVLTTDATISPLVWSALGRPRLVLPLQLMAKLNDSQIDTILAHELAHLLRGDDRVRWLELAALIVFWWNPTVWVASRSLRDSEEACCDAIVARTLPTQVEDYAHGLVATVRHLMAPEPSPLVAASGLGRPALIERRIRTMLTNRPPLPMSLFARLFMVLTAVIVFGFSPMLTAREGSTVDPLSSNGEFTGDPINLSLEEADVKDVLATFARLTNLDIVVAPDVSELVTIDIVDMPWDQALHMILQITGLSYSIDDGRLLVGTVSPLDVFEKGPEKAQVVGEFEGRPVYRHIFDGPITEPEKLDGPNPRYPEQARKEGINGVVVMEAVIGEDGSVREVEVLRSNAHVLSEAAVEAVEQWTFEPATLEGVPVAVRYVLTVKFNLQ